MSEIEHMDIQLPDESAYPEALTSDYELIECLSSQNDVQTLLVIDRKNGKRCVAKCYERESPLFDRTEPEVLKELKAPPLPGFVTECKTDAMRCILREYVPGETLAELSEHHSFTEEEVIEIGSKLCDQLAILHQMNPPVIHRDIKPQNVVVMQDGAPVLIDFGISREQSEEETDTLISGTRGFAPPEQYGFSQTDARSDVYSLGVLLYWLLHKDTKVPEKGTSSVEKVLARCTAFDPRNRYRDAVQVKKALQQAKCGGRRKWPVLLIAAIAAAAVIFGIALTAGSKEPEVIFSEPLIEQAVRMNLGVTEDDPLTQEMLQQVTGIFIVADQAYPDQDAFYPAINEWYAGGKAVRGGVTDLSDLSMLTGLLQVGIVAEELKDISPVSGLENLEKVEFKHNYITDIGGLAGMDRLTYVGINDNPVTDISPLTKCPNLSFLDLCDVRSYDPSAIAGLGNFDYLDLSNPTESYKYLDGKSVLSLRLGWTGLDDLTVLDGVTRLEDLDISHTEVADLTPLTQHTGLRVLNIAYLPVKDLSCLTDLPKLETVRISEDMQPLADELGDVPFSFEYE